MDSLHLGTKGKQELPLPVANPPKPARRQWRTLALVPPVVLLACLWAAGCPVSLNSWRTERPEPIPGTPRNPAYLVKAYNGAVASENRICSDVGVRILKEGGNAVDSVIATTFCIGVVNMFSSGIGGGGFMTVRLPPAAPGAASEVYTIDFRETAPALANETMYRDDPMASRYGGLAVGIPGELRGLEEAHRRWATLPWETLVQPSIEIAKRITWYPFMLHNPDWSDIFAPEGRYLKEGEIIRRTNLSTTLTAIAKGGSDAFYKGPIADSLLEKIRRTGGIMSQSDFLDYKVKVRPALKGTFRGRNVYTSHAPTSGPVLLHMLNLIEHYDLEERTGLNVHRIVEIMKFGFAARTKICDPAFTNSSKRIDEISTKDFAGIIFPNITDDRTHPPEYYNPEFDVKVDHGTSHTSVVDKSGMAVALTSTVNFIFGSQILDPVTGVILNNEMDDFSTPGVPNGFGLYPSPYNYPQPGKRPLSSTVPTILEHEDGSFYLAVGGSGGSQIFPAVFQTLINLDWGLDASQAVEYGRLHDQLYPLATVADNVYPAQILEDLRERGHNVTVLDVNRVAAVVQLVVQQNGTIYAASDSRKNGVATGY
ncbi:nucleophile aminohydrolase [Ephemerocybe angulata]|uniref:Glutathione hydrolase n=1 Tax=Ephemerocybe angulata TaxID=980116 RepID=A0A8H6I943_9AGAR|nr:nucleophile aminohydrolase [Tulosesus angulatus]